MVERVLFSPGGATEVTLAAILTELGQKLEAGQAVALDAGTLAALESINAAISNWPADYPDAAAAGLLTSILAKLNGSVAVTGPLTDAQLRALPVDVDAGLPLDVFGNLVTGDRENQIEVHFDDSNYAAYLTSTFTGGSAAQANGQVRYSTGTTATGRARAVTLDVVKYRPMHEVYFAFTAAFLTAGAANTWQRIGAFTDTDGIFLGYEGTSFGITYRNNGVVTSIDRASWADPCTGAPGSKYTRNGVPETLNPAKLNVYRVRLGWLGSAGFTVEVLSPDWEWVTLYRLAYPNQADTPYLANADLPMAIDIGKTTGAVNYVVATNCWAGGTTSAKSRLSDPLSDRSLAETVRSLITGRTTGGGGGFVDVKVNPSGALATDASGSVVALDSTTLAALETINAIVSNWPADFPDATAQASLASILAKLNASLAVTGPLTDTQLRAAAVPVSVATLPEIEVKNDAGNPLGVSGTVTNVDAAEKVGLIRVPFTVSGAGDNDIATPTTGKAVRLRRIMATMSDPDGTSNPLLKMMIGATEVCRGFVLSGRFDVTGAVDAHLILNLSKAGSVSGTAFYEEV